MRPGESFEDIAVADHYRHRPDYPADLFAKLYALSPKHRSALDLGCGTGKIARRVCGVFDAVTAVDATASMLSVARSLQETGSQNINWVCSRAEEADFADCSFDLIVAAASIHWMDHALLFPRLLNHVADDYVFAVVDGDGAYQPPWQKEWDKFLSRWIFDLKGERYEPGDQRSTFARRMTRHRDWLAVKGEAFFEHQVSQTVEDFIRCQFSRDTFAPSKLESRIEEFAEDLRQVVSPHADDADKLVYRVQSRVEWGEIRPV